ncbi:hypothetical protein COU53_00175 [Candidatus Pacearchaeota archaeon CG10_big_fil_rev_8_21_14_0_10_30_48]|nr:MAG: hypothetical protein COU53_00175 [Candidatus Pacearchaeota archaeon CG10_big_fil_rev_8_21_14_0_10_30_48]
MKVKYDSEIDAMFINFQEGEYEFSKEIGDGIIIDLSKEGKVLRIEILDASEKISKENLKNMIL